MADLIVFADFADLKLSQSCKFAYLRFADIGAPIMEKKCWILYAPRLTDKIIIVTDQQIPP